MDVLRTADIQLMFPAVPHTLLQDACPRSLITKRTLNQCKMHRQGNLLFVRVEKLSSKSPSLDMNLLERFPVKGREVNTQVIR